MCCKQIPISASDFIWDYGSAGGSLDHCSTICHKLTAEPMGPAAVKNAVENAVEKAVKKAVNTGWKMLPKTVCGRAPGAVKNAVDFVLHTETKWWQ